jgi:hypothetical protein
MLQHHKIDGAAASAACGPRRATRCGRPILFITAFRNAAVVESPIELRSG